MSDGAEPAERGIARFIGIDLREGSGRFWLFRRYPERYPLPRDAGWRLPLLAVGAMHANGVPLTRANGRAGGR